MTVPGHGVGEQLVLLGDPLLDPVPRTVAVVDAVELGVDRSGEDDRGGRRPFRAGIGNLHRGYGDAQQAGGGERAELGDRRVAHRSGLLDLVAQVVAFLLGLALLDQGGLLILPGGAFGDVTLPHGLPHLVQATIELFDGGSGGLRQRPVRLRRGLRPLPRLRRLLDGLPVLFEGEGEILRRRRRRLPRVEHRLCRGPEPGQGETVVGHPRLHRRELRRLRGQADIPGELDRRSPSRVHLRLPNGHRVERHAVRVVQLSSPLVLGGQFDVRLTQTGVRR
jgi:hypothetical protein